MTDTPGTNRPPTAAGSDRGALEPRLPGGRTVAPDRPAAPATSSGLPSWVIPMIVLALVAGLGVGMAVGMLLGGQDDSGSAATTTAGSTSTVTWETADAYGAAVSVRGEALPVLQEGTADTALGRAMPEITGTDYAGNTLAITADGQPKLIVAVAHWCPYCNQEVPILNDWYAAGIPEGLEVFALSVYADSGRANFPPGTWVEDVAFALPLIADDEARTLVQTLGIPAVPFWVAVLPDGRVALRATGQLDADAIDQIVAALLAPREETTTTVP
jgi:cytochrome c biogenesis protein CcmG, thiol:disulfide interchange protein DsbE